MLIILIIIILVYNLLFSYKGYIYNSVSNINSLILFYINFLNLYYLNKFIKKYNL
jgi:hypothetical protein